MTRKKMIAAGTNTIRHSRSILSAHGPSGCSGSCGNVWRAQPVASRPTAATTPNITRRFAAETLFLTPSTPPARAAFRTAPPPAKSPSRAPHSCRSHRAEALGEGGIGELARDPVGDRAIGPDEDRGGHGPHPVGRLERALGVESGR